MRGDDTAAGTTHPHPPPQEELETVIPRLGGKVLIVNGAFRGEVLGGGVSGDASGAMSKAVSLAA